MILVHYARADGLCTDLEISEDRDPFEVLDRCMRSLGAKPAQFDAKFAEVMAARKREAQKEGAA